MVHQLGCHESTVFGEIPPLSPSPSQGSARARRNSSSKTRTWLGAPSFNTSHQETLGISWENHHLFLSAYRETPRNAEILWENHGKSSFSVKAYHHDQIIYPILAHHGAGI